MATTTLDPKELFIKYQDEITVELFGDDANYYDLPLSAQDAVNDMAVERSKDAVADAIDAAHERMKYSNLLEPCDYKRGV